MHCFTEEICVSSSVWLVSALAAGSQPGGNKLIACGFSRLSVSRSLGLDETKHHQPEVDQQRRPGHCTGHWTGWKTSKEATSAKHKKFVYEQFIGSRWRQEPEAAISESAVQPTLMVTVSALFPSGLRVESSVLTRWKTALEKQSVRQIVFAIKARLKPAMSMSPPAPGPQTPPGSWSKPASAPPQ